MASKAWPYEEARKLLKRWPDGKPQGQPMIFETALAGIGATARETLFVGDRPDIDVVGARRVGMAVAWLNAGVEALPAGLPAPDHEVRDLAGVLRVLEENT